MPRVQTAHLYVALVLLTAAAYLPVWDNGFIDFDDEKYITLNPQVIEGLSASGLGWALTTYHGSYWQPLSWLSLQFDAHFFSARSPDGTAILSPVAFHAQGLFWHTASVLLLFGLGQRLTGARWRSFLIAALFAVHPMHVESVAWAAERKDVLSMFFGLLTVWAYAGYAEAPSRRRYLGVMAAFLLSLMSKPMLLTLPFVLLLLDYWPLQRVASGQWLVTRKDGPPSSLATRHWPLATLVLEKVPLLLMAAAVGVVTVLARRQGGIPVSLTDLPVSARVANAFTAYGWYVAHSVVPVRLCALYLHPIENWSVSAVLAGAGLLLGGTLLAVWQARRRPWLIVGWLWFVVTLLPVIGFAQGGAQAWADRFCYWPHIGLFVVAVWGLTELAGRLRLPARAVAAAAAAVVGAFAAMTWVQVGYWHDTVTLWERTLAVTGDNHIAQMHLGKYYMEQGRFDEAVAHWSEAVRLSPRVNDYRCALGLTFLSMGRLDEADAQYRQALGRDPGRTDAWYNLGIVKLRMAEPERAERCFRRALELEPESADDLAMLGQAVWRQGRRTEGIGLLKQALARDPRQADAWHGLAVAYLAQGRGAEAIEALQQTLRYNPRQLSARSELGVALGRAGRWGEAVSCHAEAVQTLDRSERQLAAMGGRIPDVDGIPQLVFFQCRLAYALHFCGQQRAAVQSYRAAGERDPHWPEQFAAKARQLAADPDPSLRDPQQAYELAEQAVAGVTDPPADLLDPLAVALAARGDFDEATRTGQQALDKATAAGDITLANGIRDRLLLYRERKPVPGSCP